VVRRLSRTKTLVKLDPIGTGSLQVGEQLFTDRDSEETGQKRLEVQLGLASLDGLPRARKGSQNHRASLDDLVLVLLPVRSQTGVTHATTRFGIFGNLNLAVQDRKIELHTHRSEMCELLIFSHFTK
jgi:hypothetical protein